MVIKPVRDIRVRLLAGLDVIGRDEAHLVTWVLTAVFSILLGSWIGDQVFAWLTRG